MNRDSYGFVKGFALTFGAYIVLVFVSNYLLKRIPNDGWSYLVAILPILPLLFSIPTFLNYLRNMDELQQRIYLQAFGFAAAATGMLTLTYGFLENAGLPHLSMLWVFPLISLLWGGAYIVLTRRYQ